MVILQLGRDKGEDSQNGENQRCARTGESDGLGGVAKVDREKYK